MNCEAHLIDEEACMFHKKQQSIPCSRAKHRQQCWKCWRHKIHFFLHNLSNTHTYVILGSLRNGSSYPQIPAWMMMMENLLWLRAWKKKVIPGNLLLWVPLGAPLAALSHSEALRTMVVAPSPKNKTQKKLSGRRNVTDQKWDRSAYR